MKKALPLFALLFLFLNINDSYAQDRQLIRRELLIWDDATQDWASYWFSNYEYLDAFNSHRYRVHRYRPDGSSYLSNVYTEYQNVLGELIEKIKDSYLYESEVLTKIKRGTTTFEYNSNNLLSRETFLSEKLMPEGVLDEVVSAFRYNFEYDDNNCQNRRLTEGGIVEEGRLTGWYKGRLVTTQSTPDCIPEERIESSFWPSGNQEFYTRTRRADLIVGDTTKTTTFHDIWDEDTNMWVENFTAQYAEVYNDADQLTYSEANHPYYPRRRYILEYNDQSLIESQIEEVFVDSTETWQYFEITEYNYTNNTYEIVARQYHNGVLSAIVQTLETNDDEGLMIAKDKTTESYFADTIIGVEVINEEFIRFCDGTLQEHYETRTYNNQDNPESRKKTVYTYTGTDPCDPFWVTKDDIRLFPNPSTGLINVESPLLSAAEASVRIFNALGQMVFEARYNDSQGRQAIYLPGLPVGTYRLFIQADGERNSTTIVMGQ